MLNKLVAFVERYQMVQPGDAVVCAVSGGADSMALLWAMYLLRDKLQLRLSAAHFNHGLRGAESNRDEAFVRDFCAGYQIPFVCGTGQVSAGKKGLEAAAREARYAFLRSLPGKIATAHTADDNAETVLMHLVRGTGLKGLGGIAPVNGSLIRPMLSVTREEVLVFLKEYSIPYVEDSTNGEDAFLRNRLRHKVMPLLRQENPAFAPNLSATALRLRQDEAALEAAAEAEKTNDVAALRRLQPAVRNRVLSSFLQQAGVKEPEAAHISALEKLVFSAKPSAKAHFPGGITVARNYEALEVLTEEESLLPQELLCPGTVQLPDVQITCKANTQTTNTAASFAVVPKGRLVVRSREAGDAIRLSGGTKSLKKLFADKKIPAARRDRVPVIADDEGVVGVVGIGANLKRISEADDAVRIEIEYR